LACRAVQHTDNFEPIHLGSFVMSIPPVSSLNIAASIAGTERAAAMEVSAGQNKGRGAAGAVSATDAIVEPTEKVSKSELSGDSDADGRQMLDTFERQNRDSPKQQNDGDEGLNTDDASPSVTSNRPTLGGHIDLCC
jgi:hypothetical protein